MTSGNSRVYTGVPRERVYITEFVDNRDNILHEMAKSGIGGALFQAEGHRVDRNRDQIVKRFLETDDEWLIMLDSDMIHPHTCALRLREWNTPVVGALYFHRGRNHVPLVYKKAHEAEDEYGRMRPLWQPLYDEVYDFLQNNHLPMLDNAYAVDDYMGEALTPCDAVGTGCMLIHRSVLEKMKPPWFEYRHGWGSEDLDFCDRIKEEQGIQVYADLSTICGHMRYVPMGHVQFRKNFEALPMTISRPQDPAIFEQLGDFLGISTDDATKSVEEYREEDLALLWSEHEGSTLDFYKRTDVGELYLRDLIRWNFTQDFLRIQQDLVPHREVNVLVIGSGIGTIAAQMFMQRCNVWAVEVNDTLREFSRYRKNILLEDPAWRLGELSYFWNLDDALLNAPMLDLVIAVDVFEHMDEQVLGQTITDVSRKMKIRSRLFFHNMWGIQNVYPMHYDHSEYWENYLFFNDLFALNNMLAVKLRDG